MAIIQMKINAEQKIIVQNLAKSEYLSVSALLRKLALDYAKSKQEASTNHDNFKE